MDPYETELRGNVERFTLVSEAFRQEYEKYARYLEYAKQELADYLAAHGQG